LPRTLLLQGILDVLSHVPAVSKLAKDTLLQTSDAVSANETKEELRVLVHGLLNQSPNVRNFVLQALEPFDLEETENPEIIYLAVHDADERNAELAASLWEANALSLEPSGTSRLFSLLRIRQSRLVSDYRTRNALRP
jgi:hypothetical protein